LKVEFMKGPSHYVDVSAIGARVLTESLIRDDRIDPEFNMETVLNELRAEIYLRNEISPKIDQLRPDITKVYGIALKSAASIYSAHTYAEKVPDSVKCDTVLFSSNNGVFDFPTIKSLLSSGIRVVIGGPTATISGAKLLRSQLENHGCKNLHNLIVVSGFVDLTTDLYKIINKWKDYHIEDNDFTTFWQCEKDFVQPHVRIFQKIKKENKRKFQIATIFRSGCWWKKCTFCNYHKIPACSFVGNATPSQVAHNIINSCILHSTNRVFVADDYFLFDHFNESVFEILNNNGVEIEVYSGIRMLKNVNYVKKINKYVKSISLGVESMDDFSLKYINKGYDSRDIEIAFDNVAKHCDSLEIVMMLMMDLPVKNEWSIFENYKRIKEQRNKLEENGISIHMLPKLLEVNWKLRETFVDHKYLRIAKENSNNHCGRYIIWKALEELGVVNSNVYTDRTTPLERYDSQGKMLKSDLFTIPDDLFKGLLNES